MTAALPRFALPPLPELPELAAPPAAAPAPLSPAPLSPAPVAEASAALLQRLETVEAFGTQVTAAIESLVDAVLQVKAEAQAAARQETAALQARVKELEQQLSVERSTRDFAQVSRMHPKAPRVVFVGTTYFGCNVKYAWAACRERAQALGFEVWFLPFHAEQEATVRALGGDVLPAHYPDWTPEHLHVALSAAVVVTSDHFLNPNPFAAALLAGARHLQLWHGVSIKEIGLRNLPGGRGLGPHLGRVLATCGPYASFIGTTATAEAEWRRWFAFERYVPLGYPRNDVLHREPTAADLANTDAQALAEARTARAAGQRVFLYAPTFRDADRGQWLLRAGLDRIAQAVAAQGDCLIVNLHPVEQPMIPELAKSLPGVRFVAPRTDIYPLLREADALVTDYSSVMFDFLQLQRPVLLFRPDHARYTERSRKLFDDKLQTLPGPMVDDAAALIAKLQRSDLGQQPAHARARQALAAQLFDQIDGRAGERFAALVVEEIERALHPASQRAA
jgi:CDP-glycerol glycerophosphotransferase